MRDRPATTYPPKVDGERPPHAPGTGDWNPRYLAYASAHGERDPDAMLRRDRQRWPGGCMAGFILWIGDCWAQWDRDHRHRSDHIRDQAEHRAFDEWLRGFVFGSAST